MHAPIRLTTIVPNVLDANSPRLVTPRRRRTRRSWHARVSAGRLPTPEWRLMRAHPGSPT
jgi:hypothetical protein